jgi:hypothetical protein
VALDGLTVIQPAPAPAARLAPAGHARPTGLLTPRGPLIPGGTASPAGPGLAVLPEPILYCLDADLVAIAAGARPLPSVDGLREVLRSTVEDHVAPVLAAFAPRVRRGPTGLWATATDQLTAALWSLGKATGTEAVAAAEVRALLPPAARPFVGGGGFRALDLPGGDQVLTRTRRSCCLHYTLASQDPCLTCPRINDAERIRRLCADPAVNETPEPADQ